MHDNSWNELSAHASIYGWDSNKIKVGRQNFIPLTSYRLRHGPAIRIMHPWRGGDLRPCDYAVECWGHLSRVRKGYGEQPALLPLPPRHEFPWTVWPISIASDRFWTNCASLCDLHRLRIDLRWGWACWVFLDPGRWENEWSVRSYDFKDSFMIEWRWVLLPRRWRLFCFVPFPLVRGTSSSSSSFTPASFCKLTEN